MIPTKEPHGIYYFDIKMMEEKSGVTSFGRYLASHAFSP